MSKTALIILGIICVLSLVLLIIALIPKFKLIYKRMPDILIFLLLIVVLVTGGIVAYNLLSPKGPDGLNSSDVSGSTAGDTPADTELKDKAGTGFGMEEALVGNAPGDEAVYITVHSGIISIGSVPFKNLDDFAKALSCLDLSKRPVRLVDDYALASVYHEVRDHLDGKDIHYIEETH